jgi:hypothetical protein
MGEDGIMGIILTPTITDGSTIDANDVMNITNPIVNEVNGNLDAYNIKDAAMTESKIATDAVVTTKIKDLNVTLQKLEQTVQDKLGYLTAPDATWHEVGTMGEIAFQNNWANYAPASFDTCAYRKDALGYVHIKGFVKSGTIGDVPVFTLPVGYRPMLGSFLGIVTNGAWGQLIISPDGKVKALSGSNVWFSFGYPIFKAEQ